jgi:DNA-binding MarR family transcriptional regulator
MTLRHHLYVESPEAADRGALSDLYTALVALAYTMAANRTHTRVRREADVPVDRASLAVLRVLAGSPEPLRMVELADALMVQAPHVTREVRRLEEQGLVATTRDPDDQRARRAEATEDGRETAARAQATVKQWLADELKGFSPAELRTTAAVLNGVVDAFRAR